jgi:hypothetical protein
MCIGLQLGAYGNDVCPDFPGHGSVSVRFGNADMR